ncbi:MAG: DUF2959 domain-containing protein [Lentisphaerae bacterium]|jgi:hypothetical protein|nr:DUF2959 domain-containing protein [Lentisphaerota bacterium]MBT4815659.1 DUF2959 domain-containing protein [Lentisphaerota bacterium]MBT5610330.1 DUF2959 domain-containing protein [Lentisphaerota bacterium]MBT7056158.1 DUF2959 domain-containing protein [Lentisphaerota bacterium]MBT7841920.1 DUF2959 domain-containing protein [Lentisphaerota bacterium]
MNRLMRCAVVVMLTLGVCGCRTVYYSMWEKLGKHKRDLLRDNIEDAQKEQQEAGEKFQDAFTRMKELADFDGGNLEKLYGRLSGDFERCNSAAESVRSRVTDVRTVADDLFREWESEIEEISSGELRRKSRSKLDTTRVRFEGLHRAMTAASGRMDPVLTQFRDQVLFLKHNLNAQAVGSLKGELRGIEHDVSELLREMDKSIIEARRFIRSME